MINGAKEIFIERKGLVYKAPNVFPDEESLISAMRSVAQSVGRTIDADHPRLDARLPAGSRIHVVLPPMARNGTTVAVRKFSKEELTLKDLIEFGSLSATAARSGYLCLSWKEYCGVGRYGEWKDHHAQCVGRENSKDPTTHCD